MSCLGLEGPLRAREAHRAFEPHRSPSTDVQAHAAFFERYFDFIHRSNRASPAIAIVSGDGGFTLVLQRKKRAEDTYPEGFHVGFIVADIASVERAHARLVSGGVIVGNVETNNRGTMIYCRTPGGIVVEVSTPNKRGD
jgi:catechol 2,3-dioxygenase-like lactoylglutathione lyase family enzyme